MRLSAQEYDATAEALQAEAQLGESPEERARLQATAELANRLAQQRRRKPVVYTSDK